MKKRLLRGARLFIVCMIILCLLPAGIMAEELLNQNEAIVNTESLDNNTKIEDNSVINNAEASRIIRSLTEVPSLNMDENVSRQVVVVYANSSENNIKGLSLNSKNIKSGKRISDRVDVFEVSDTTDVDAFIAELKANPDVLAVDTNNKIEVSALPNDPFVKNGYAWQFAKIGADKTWDKIANTNSIVVAVIDTGLNVSHPDMQGRIVDGFDYVAGIPEVSDVAGHGTMVSGCIAAVTNNGIGIAGVGGIADIKIAPFRVGGTYAGDPSLDLSNICAAIMAAADRSDVKVINMSFGGYEEFSTLKTAVEYAANAGKVLVASAGNEGDQPGLAGQYSYPASYENVISVTATNSGNSRADFSQYNDMVDLCAPGDSIYTTRNDGTYEYASGSSFSSPIVAGSCAVLFAANSNLGETEVENILKATALDLGVAGKDNYYGEGLIQVDAAVESILPSIPLSLDSFLTDKASGQDINTSIQLSAGASGGENPYEYKFYYQLNGSTVILNDFSTTNLATFIPTQSGTYTLYAEVKDANGIIATKSISGYVILEPVINATNIILNKTATNLIVGASEKLISTLTPSSVTNKTVSWSSSNPSVATVDPSGNVIGIIVGTAVITAKTSNNLTATCNVMVTADIQEVYSNYRAHVQNVGWQAWKSKGEISGTSGQGLRLEGIEINVDNLGYDIGVEYQTHVQNIGWQGWKSDGLMSGTSGQALRLEAIQIQLTGVDANRCDIYYQVHAENYGWLDWAKNGESAGTEGLGLRLEAIKIVMVPKGTAAPGSTTRPFVTGNIFSTYRTHVQNIGWQAWKDKGAVSGTSGQSLRLEGIEINVDNLGYDIGVEYQTHVQNIGWQGWKSDGLMSGTSGQALRLEAIQIQLTGVDANRCDIYYQVHAENYGWLDWAKNGESAGTEGLGLRLEAIKIVMVPKGSAAPGATARPFVK